GGSCSIGKEAGESAFLRVASEATRCGQRPPGLQTPQSQAPASCPCSSDRETWKLPRQSSSTFSTPPSSLQVSCETGVCLASSNPLKRCPLSARAYMAAGGISRMCRNSGLLLSSIEVSSPA